MIRIITNKYYITNIDKTIEGFDYVINALKQFEVDSEAKVVFWLSNNGIKNNRVESLIHNLSDAVRILENKKRIIDQILDTYNKEYASMFIGCCNKFEEMLKICKIHSKKLENFMQQGCPKSHPNSTACERYEIPQHNAFEDSVFGNGVYSIPIFGIDDGGYSKSSQLVILKGLLERYFFLERYCYEQIVKVLKDEEAIKKCPELCWELLLAAQESSIIANCGLHAIITPDYIEQLKNETPLYKAWINSSDKMEFARINFHNCNPFHLAFFLMLIGGIELCLDTKEYKALKGCAHDVKTILYVAENFTKIVNTINVPISMASAMYCFYLWAGFNNISDSVEYLHSHVPDSSKLKKYGMVNKQRGEITKNTEIYKRFEETVSLELSQNNIVFLTNNWNLMTNYTL